MTAVFVLVALGLFIFGRESAAQFIALLAIPVAVIEQAVILNRAATQRSALERVLRIRKDS